MDEDDIFESVKDGEGETKEKKFFHYFLGTYFEGKIDSRVYHRG
jgi:hypothetical protein